MSIQPTTSVVTATVLGPTAPIQMTGMGVAYVIGAEMVSRYPLQPSVFSSLSSGASMTWIFEITADPPDPNGNFQSPGHWVQYTADPSVGTGRFQDPRAFPVNQQFTGIRANIQSITSPGTLTLQVVQ